MRCTTTTLVECHMECSNSKYAPSFLRVDLSLPCFSGIGIDMFDVQTGRFITIVSKRCFVAPGAGRGFDDRYEIYLSGPLAVVQASTPSVRRFVIFNWQDESGCYLVDTSVRQSPSAIVCILAERNSHRETQRRALLRCVHLTGSSFI